ncbi:hypothetical protein E6O75_ATG07961 [Venturia nashicola]|uniref:Uncharacterized protein n=1 Tax=Venturia nashicola TaxID=86259 RepID=A0A4Z1NLN3_9PEZI|nr:hypothetical protein E6O75_ATG07961 [Venturia nashicola]
MAGRKLRKEGKEEMRHKRELTHTSCRAVESFAMFKEERARKELQANDQDDPRLPLLMTLHADWRLIEPSIGGGIRNLAHNSGKLSLRGHSLKDVLLVVFLAQIALLFQAVVDVDEFGVFILRGHRIDKLGNLLFIFAISAVQARTPIKSVVEVSCKVDIHIDVLAQTTRSVSNWAGAGVVEVGKMSPLPPGFHGHAVRSSVAEHGHLRCDHISGCIVVVDILIFFFHFVVVGVLFSLFFLVILFLREKVLSKVAFSQDVAWQRWEDRRGCFAQLIGIPVMPGKEEFPDVLACLKVVPDLRHHEVELLEQLHDLRWKILWCS